MTSSLRGVPLTIAVVLLATSGFGFRRDELLCDAAALHLSECCPELAAADLDCSYSNACGESFPELSVAESDCIRDRACDEIVEAGVCDRVAARLAADSAGVTTAGDVEEAVCP